MVVAVAMAAWFGLWCDSGMVIQTIREGTGATPLPTDTVKASTYATSHAPVMMMMGVIWRRS